MSEYKTPLLPPPLDEPKRIPAGEDRSPWSRQPGESETEYAKFEEYMNQTKPRVLRRPGNGGHIELQRTFRERKWAERVEALDVWMQSVLDYEMEGFLKETAKARAARHLAFLHDALSLVEMEFARLRARAEAGNHDGVIKPADLIRLSELVVKLRRLEFGESTENVGPAVTVDLSKMSLEELRTMKELAAKMHSEDDKPEPQVH